MDFITTARMLMDMREKHPHMRYRFEGGELHITLNVEDDVPGLFDDAKAMFEPA